MWQRLPLVFVGFTLTACAAPMTTTQQSRSMGMAGMGREVLTAAEIVASRVTDVYQAVMQLRPEFLRRRPISQPITPFTTVSIAVYLDDMPYGSAESLRQIPLDRVRLIRYLSPTEANLKYGGSHAAGAILVTTMAKP
jgi:hypothetical protein